MIFCHCYLFYLKCLFFVYLIEGPNQTGFGNVIYYVYYIIVLLLYFYYYYIVIIISTAVIIVMKQTKLVQNSVYHLLKKVAKKQHPCVCSLL